MDEWNEWVKTPTFMQKRHLPLFLEVQGKDPLTHSFQTTAIQQVVLILDGDWAVRPW